MPGLEEERLGLLREAIELGEGEGDAHAEEGDGEVGGGGGRVRVETRTLPKQKASHSAVQKGSPATHGAQQPCPCSTRKRW